MRTLQSVKATKYTIYFNFDNGRFGTRSYEAGKWTNAGISDEELKAARKVAFDNETKKWKSWRKPAGLIPAAPAGTLVRKDEETLDQEAWDLVRNQERAYRARH